jgi:subfamily B ATP-binding cassette protein MsbA
MQLNPYAGAWKYLLVFRRHLGRRMYLVFFLAIVAALAEGVGITLLLPLLTTLDMGIGAAEIVPAPLQWIVETLGISGSMLGILLLIGVVFLLKALLLFGYHAYSSILHAQLQRELKGRLFDACRQMSYSYYITRNTGHFVNVLNAQAEGLFRSFTNYKSFLSGVIQAAAYVGFAFLVAWQMALALLVFGALLLSLFSALNNYVRQLSRKTAQEASQLNKVLVQSLQAFKYLTSTRQMDQKRGQYPFLKPKRVLISI